jgi:hypothetical protein
MFSSSVVAMAEPGPGIFYVVLQEICLKGKQYVATWKNL